MIQPGLLQALLDEYKKAFSLSDNEIKNISVEHEHSKE